MNYANYDIIDSPVGIIDAWYILLQATFTPRHGGMPKHISPHYTHHYRAAPSTKERREQGGQGDHAPPPMLPNGGKGGSFECNQSKLQLKIQLF